MFKKYWFYLVTLFSVVALASAFVAEFYFDLAPCDMCLKQREPYYVIIAGFIFIAIIKWQHSIWFYLGVQIISVYGLFYSIWHVGIEQNILKGPASCSGSLLQTDSVQDLKQQITNKPVINCSDIIWSIGGLSAATINSILQLFILCSTVFSICFICVGIILPISC